MITPAQCRMARSALRWKAQDLADRAHVSRNTVTRFELEQGPPNESTMVLLRQALEAAGVEFRPDGSVRLREAADAEL
jgi:transcriptional regulator with XRE-family HTH domain